MQALRNTDYGKNFQTICKKDKRCNKKMNFFGFRYLVNAYRGYIVWKKIIRENHLEEQDNVMVLGESCVCNYYALKYLDIFKSKNHIRNIVLVTSDKNMFDVLPLFSGNILNIQIFSQREIACFIDFYTIFTTEKRIQIISLDNPFGRNTSSIVGLKGLRIEEIVYIGMLKLGEYHPLPDIIYDGTNKNIKQFMLEKENEEHERENKL